ncbi:MAG: hypothetical protein U0359_39530 [Byssovorax sp.]
MLAGLSPSARSIPVVVVLFAGLALALAGCGHPATKEECEELFAKSAEIELRGQNVTDPKTITDRTAAARATPRGAEFAAACAGKRITQSALDCVRRATTAEQFDKCL